MSSPLAVGLLRVVLHIPDSGSLKSKRQVISGLLRRVRSQFQVAAAEVGERDRWQLAELAVACVSADSRHADEVLVVAVPLPGERGVDRVMDVVRPLRIEPVATVLRWTDEPRIIQVALRDQEQVPEYCAKCGAEIQTAAHFCVACGSPALSRA